MPIFDYTAQAWIDDTGRYMRCGHPETMRCSCYGRAHAGERAPVCDLCLSRPAVSQGQCGPCAVDQAYERA